MTHRAAGRGPRAKATRSPSSVIIIGAGFAGLAAALRLAQAGVRVTVLDALDCPGGKAALGYRDFSSGPTVVTMPQVFRSLYRRLNWEAPQLSPARPTTRYHALNGRTFAPEALSVAGSLEPTLAQLTRAEGRRYAELLHLSRQLYRDAADTFIFAPPPTLPRLGRYALAAGRTAQPGRPLASLVQSGPFMTPFWLRFATYLGADPYRAPAVLHNIPWVELGGGVWHLGAQRAGSQQKAGGLLGLAHRMSAEAERLGVQFRYGTRVTALRTEGGRVASAQTDAGEVQADAFVSAVDISRTRQLLGGGAPRRPQGVSGFAVQLRLTADLGQGHHIFWPTDYRGEWQDIRAGRLPLDPTLYLHLDGGQGFLLVNAPATPARETDRREYAAYLLRRLQDRFGLPMTEALALSPADYTRTAATGALYGAAPHGLLGSLRPGWRVAGLGNLRQVGGTVHPGGGVPLSLLGGWNGAGELLGLPYDALGGPEL
ncbi:phytoene desaturase family protein [Deinococcus radiophilus]|uniref:NAD(P)/FAD-dependent oxidoreductase n=1 Tax=Deinococcus radiophilus TaxID=32062 RepID=A0A3S0KCH8_9DEIO|nr:NAD(P)/FAD-dependent oxidoreductase [Deinococcus radiophilus]RTR27524.1 NAD(P)/FAD-dependent oxidoreductase [Deinococcus radiophilus]UFA50397.1 NAD(P)/FAD-dependent oxidoreductase [Deinococcus radiophilus]